MTPELVHAEYVSDFRIDLRFDDGRAAVVDLADELWGEVFEPLKDPEVFRHFRLNREANTVTWPTGADFAPEYLYERVIASQGGGAGGGARRD